MATAALRDRRDAPGDGGVGAGLLADLEGVAEQQVEGGAGDAAPPGRRPTPRRPGRGSRLSPSTAESSPARDLEQVPHGLAVVVDVEVVGEVLGGEEGRARRGSRARRRSPVEPLGHGVDLGAVAGGQRDGLGRGALGRPGRAAPSAGAHRRPSSARAGRAVRCGGSGRWRRRDTFGAAPGPRRASPARRRSSIPDSSAVRQPGTIVDRPLGPHPIPLGGEEVEQLLVLRPDRSRPAAPATTRARAGLRPPVETVTHQVAPRTTAGSVNEQRSGSSALLTHAPAASASSWTCWLTAVSSVADTARR